MAGAMAKGEYSVPAGSPTDAGLGSPAITRRSHATDKIALFRSLFRGREDVYPRRFSSLKTGRSGYAPACANEWVRGLCEKPRIPCADCPNRRFLPVTDEVLRRHLVGLVGFDESGRDFVLGVYPMLLDESCYFLAADFDRASWREDSAAFSRSCEKLGLPVALERSRSGNRGHVWLFFAEAIPAVLARKLGSLILTVTMEGRPDLGFRSYDRFFPNQDTLPRGGFGNLIALPLQGKARKNGNSVFVNDSFNPHSDQWAFLSALGRISRVKAEEMVREGERRGRILAVRWVSDREEEDDSPWSAPPSRRRGKEALPGPLPSRLEMVLGDQIYIPKQDLAPGLRNRLLRVAAFQNPEFYRAQAMRLSTFGKPRIIDCAEDHPQYVALPRGCRDDVETCLGELGIEAVWRDERFSGRPLDASFRGELRPEQQAAAEALAAQDAGVLAASTAFGKTVVAAWLIARRRVNTLVLVHRSQLLEQWIARLTAFLDLGPGAIGHLGGGRRRLTGALDVALIQSLIRKGVVQDCVGDYGHLVVDECHHLSAPGFEQVARRAKARFITGLSATVTRKDGHHPIIFMQCGPVRFRVDAKGQAAKRPFGHEVIVRPTGFRWDEPLDSGRSQVFPQLYAALAASAPRNGLICRDVVEAVGAGRSPLVLTERKEHLRELEARLRGVLPHVVAVEGGMGRRAFREAMEQHEGVPEGSGRVLLATGRFIGEGFDDARLDTLFLTLPVSWRGVIAQYAGRLHRDHAGKKAVRVFDYADLDVPMLERMFRRRCRGYEAIGYDVQLPASAMPGWPPETPLPADAEWKNRYAASVRRLAQDGVDVPLAGLFAKAAGPLDPEAAGDSRARSAAEAFLYRRLESLPGFQSRFALNVELPIAFDGLGKMEVDFLCAESRVVVEVDGSQHLGDPEAYRRDRRKDALLQENGYFVLRFLAEDVTQRLDGVLEAVQRAVLRRARKPELSPPAGALT